MGTENIDTTSANDLGGADDLLSPMEATDSDDVRNADGDEVVDPPEDWSGADKFGMSTDEQREGDTLDHRLAEEEPDIVPEVVEGSDVASGPPGVHHGQIDGVPEDGESLFPVIDDVTRRSDEP
ncbi:hypothetical protein C6A86_022225 [Mycobacterium sp. ITM-2016-00316]|uniref:hypothetical protein n=1 Tax=Mycobacterium sp. ITM-2016-00316 TaxID=2099695 RepID=UPI000CFA1D42|nr:hypothetical protein [Mycobacterium sp. ITM-2016-00316]WNG80892.1 hypothetical protein C6A86_022225 [Mycobacterium sp. ITM-2016-00316]